MARKPKPERPPRPCDWCGKLIENPNRQGPEPRYCDTTCKDRYWAKQRSSEGVANTRAELAFVSSLLDRALEGEDLDVLRKERKAGF